MVLQVIFWIVLIYLGVTVGYLFLLSVAGRWWYRNRVSAAPAGPRIFRRIAVLVPAYKEDGIIVSTAAELLRQDYPYFDVHILADSLQKETLEQLETLPVTVWKMSFLNSSKSRAINAYFQRCQRVYDVILICDSDNVLGSGFLQKINLAFDHGALAVQGRRVAKNIDTSFAILDACSEAINNHLFRQGANGLGLSSCLIGSGMAFEYVLFRDAMASIESVGEDKVLQLSILEKGISILYMDDALIFDEKIDSSMAFQQQRRRWLYNHYVNLTQFFIPGCKQFLKGNINYFIMAVWNNLVMPRAFLLAIIPLFTVAAYFIYLPFAWCGAAIYLLYIAALLIAIPAQLFRKELLRALIHLPKAIVLMLLTTLKLRSAGKTFIHTVHSKTSVNNHLFNQ